MKKLISIILLLNLTACATVFSGSTQEIKIKVVDAKSKQNLSDIACSLKEPNGVTHVTTTNPGTVSVNRGNGALDITCTKDGYKQGQTMAGDSFNAVTLVNVLFWPGFFVDWASGAHKKYPSHFVVEMEEVTKTTK